MQGSRKNTSTTIQNKDFKLNFENPISTPARFHMTEAIVHHIN